MRILMVHDPGAGPGGIETYLAHLEQGLRARGHQPSRFAPPRTGDAAAVASAAAACRELRPELVHVHRLENPELYRALRREAPLVQSIHDHRACCPGATRLRRDGRACTRVAGEACTVQGVLGRCAGVPRWPQLAWSRVAGWKAWTAAIDRDAPVVVASRFVRDVLVGQGWSGAAIHVLPYPLPFDADPPPSAAESSTVLFAGRLVEPDKGVELFVDVFERLPPATRGVIAGDGPARARIERLLRQRSLADRVVLTGWLDGERLRARFREAAVVVMTSRWPEPSGLAGLEALMQARPVVATDVGGVAEWLRDGEFGYRLPASEPAVLADRVRSLLADPALRGAMGRAGREWVRSHRGVDRHLDAIEALYEAAAAPPRRVAIA